MTNRLHGGASVVRQRPKLDLAKGIASMVDASTNRAEQRFEENKFAAAQRLLEQQPTALGRPSATSPEPRPEATSDSSARENTNEAFDPDSLKIGQVYRVPTQFVDPNPVSARHFYRMKAVEEIVESLADGEQDVAANGFVHKGRIVLLDGGTRLRAVRANGLPSMDVKIEQPPADLKEQYKRSRDLNALRSTHTHLDTAVNIEKLLNQGAYASADECAADLGLSKSEISMYRRIARIPERFLARMNEHEKTAGIAIPYEISGIFAGSDYAADPERFNRILEDVIEEIQTKDLTRIQAKALLELKIQGPKSRLRAETVLLKFGPTSGTLKTFPSRGQVDFSFKGLTPEQMIDLQDRIHKAIGSHTPAASE